MSAALRSLAFSLLALGCATGGKDGGNGPIDAPVPTDGPRLIDAPRGDAPMIDAMIDAAPMMIDAAPGGICNGNSDCTAAGECCVTVGGPGICAPGDIVFGTCFPQ